MKSEEQFFAKILRVTKRSPPRIVLPESGDERVVEAARKIQNEGFAVPVLVSTHDIPGVEVIRPVPEERHVSYYVEKRGCSRREATNALHDPVQYAMVLVALGEVHGVVCGANHPSADTYRAAIRLVGTSQDTDLVSSTFIMFDEEDTYFFADCAVNIDPDAGALAQIARSTAQTASSYGFEPRVGMLSYSTRGSASGTSAEAVQEATRLVETEDFFVTGDVQFDAAFDTDVHRSKTGEVLAQPCNVYVFPSLDAGNIGYKIAQRLGGLSAIGPITQGLRKPVNDLSRGCSVKDIVETVAVTAYQ
jgi:phosphate acetyltransferase